jgi:dTDP-glucose 4,6-dehydratase
MFTYQHPDELIPLFVTNLFRGKTVPVYGTGENVRDWLFVKDNCRALCRIVEQGESGEDYNVAGNNEMINMEVTQAILDELNRSERYIEFVEDRQGHDYRYVVDDKKVRTFGWEPLVDFAEGLDRTIE